jgi:hypothetical protein
MCTIAMPRRNKTNPTPNPTRERPMPRPFDDRRDALTTRQRRKVRRVRAAIRAGEYENALKLEVAVDRLLERLIWENA